MSRATFRHGIALFALSVAFTWPLGNVADPVLARHDDPLFSVWRLAWIAHQLPRDPLHLFDANIFFPTTNTLALSDAMLLLGLIAAPFIWFGMSPIIVHNLLVIVAFVTAALAMMRLMRYYTNDRAATWLAGLIFAFAPFRVAHLAHLELLWTAFLPLALLALYRLLEQPTSRRGVLLGLAVGLQALCSLYYAVFLTIWLAAALALAPLHVSIRWSRRHGTALALAVGTALILLIPYLAPYASARQAVGARTPHDVQIFSATWSDYLHTSPANRAYPSAPRGFEDERTLFPGVIATVLAVCAVVGVRQRAVLATALLTLLAVDLSLGVNGYTFGILRQLIPALASFRSPARFGILALLGIAILAGLGATRLLALLGSTSRRLAAVTVALAIVGEYWTAPVATYRAPLAAGQLEQWLAAQPRTIVAMLPMPPASRLWGYETVFQYLTTFHWQPVINGYSGFAPTEYLQLLESMMDYPSAAAVAALRQRGVSVVAFYEQYSDSGQFDRFLYACQNRTWFDEVHLFAELGRGRSAACRLTSTSATLARQ